MGKLWVREMGSGRVMGKTSRLREGNGREKYVLGSFGEWEDDDQECRTGNG